MTIAEEMRQLGLEQGRQQGLQEARTIAEEMRQLGLEQGRQQGLQQGLQQGQLALLIEQLQTKFGSIDEQVIQRLNAADEAALKRYALRILTAATLTEVFANEV